MDKKMFAKQRRHQLVALLQEQQSMGTQELAKRMRVSAITVRRDLDQLEEEGLIERVHGGAVLVSTPDPVLIDEPEHQVKLGVASDEKRAIAIRAALEVKDRSMVILDSGTTCLALARELAGRPITVIALDTQVAQVAAVGVTQVHLIGGHVRNNYFSLVGPWAQEILQKLHAETFFMGADAITPDGISNSMIEEAQIKRMAVEQSKRTVLLADHTKIDKKSLVGVVPLSKIDLWVTDVKASPLLPPYRALMNAIEVVEP